MPQAPKNTNESLIHKALLSGAKQGAIAGSNRPDPGIDASMTTMSAKKPSQDRANADSGSGGKSKPATGGKGFEESKHPRGGNLGNPGQFSKSSAAAGASAGAIEASEKAGKIFREEREPELENNRLAEQAAESGDHEAAAKMHNQLASHHDLISRAYAQDLDIKPNRLYSKASRAHLKAKEAHIAAESARKAAAKLGQIVHKPGVAKGLFNALKHAAQSGVKGAKELHDAVGQTFDDFFKSMGA